MVNININRQLVALETQ